MGYYYNYFLFSPKGYFFLPIEAYLTFNFDFHMNRFFLFIALLFLSLNILAQYPQRSAARASLAPFYHGVASGDPLQDRVIIWTRVTTTDTIANVQWRVATDTSMVNIADSGTVVTSNKLDFTVKVDATNLSPNTYYYYEFEYQGMRSVRGRTKTAAKGDIDSLRFAVVSCASYAHGYFNAYDRITERNDVSAVIHLGDYYYEYGSGQYGSARPYQPTNEILNLSDYRMRLSHYRLDESLMRLHQQYPFICVWDDHETANNSWKNGADNHNNGEGNWFDRKAEAIKAYFEWMPVRMPDPTVDTQRIYRKFRYGDLVELNMLDTRLQGRQQQGFSNANASTRTLLGKPQFDWLTNNLDTSTAQWQVIGQQVMMAPLDVNPLPFGQQYGNSDQWDGYARERTNLYDSIFANNIQNIVVLTGDIHTSWANDLPTASYNGSTGSGSAGVEFVVTSVTSPSLDAVSNLGSSAVSLLASENEHMKYIDLTEKGYYILDINKQRTQADWYYVDRVDQLSPNEQWGASWKTDHLSRKLSVAIAASLPSTTQTGTPAPLDPRAFTTSTRTLQDKNQNVLISIYPNPFTNQISMQYTIAKTGEVNLYLFDMTGKALTTKSLGTIDAGIQRTTFNINNLSAGTYVLVLDIDGVKQKRIVVKQ